MAITSTRAIHFSIQQQLPMIISDMKKKDVCHNLQMAPFDSTFFMFFPIVILPRYYVLVWSSSKPFTKILFLIVVDAPTTFVKVCSNHRRVRLQKFA